MPDAEHLLLFTDGSVNTKTNTGWGAYLAVSDIEIPPEKLMRNMKMRRFTETSSSKLEIQTLIWALSEVLNFNGKITVYTDSQTIVGLADRRFRLQNNNYHSKSGRLINNSDLYREFFAITDQINCEFLKIKGHKKTGLKDNIDRLFTLVDRGARNAVRNENLLKTENTE